MSSLNCSDLSMLLGEFIACEETVYETKLPTHCLYPSFDIVSVFITALREGYRVHDGAGAARVAWDYGCSNATVARALNEQALTYDLKVTEQMLAITVGERGWLVSAILAVANASAAAAHSLLDEAGLAVEDRLKQDIELVLDRTVGKSGFSKEVQIVGRSGKSHVFDFAARKGSGASLILIQAIRPSPISISSKYVTFADTISEVKSDYGRYAVYNKDFGVNDMSLVQQVADLVPLRSLSNGLRREALP